MKWKFLRNLHEGFDLFKVLYWSVRKTSLKTSNPSCRGTSRFLERRIMPFKRRYYTFPFRLITSSRKVKKCFGKHLLNRTRYPHDNGPESSTNYYTQNNRRNFIKDIIIFFSDKIKSYSLMKGHTCITRFSKCY